MSDFIAFVQLHWLWWVLLVVLVIAFALMEWIDKALGLLQLQPQQVVDRVNHQNAVVIDIRSAGDFQQGHIAHAVNIPRTDLTVQKLTVYQSRPIILVCQLGQSVKAVGKQLQRQGLKNVMYLEGGMTRWLTDNLPVVKN